MEIWPAILVSGLELRDPAIPRLELHRARTRRRDRGDQFDGLPDPVPARLEAEDDLDLDLARGPQEKIKGGGRAGGWLGGWSRPGALPPLARRGRPCADQRARSAGGVASDARHAVGRLRHGKRCRGPKTFTSHSTRRGRCAPGCRGLILTVFVFAWGLPVGEDRAQRHLRADLPDRRAAPADREGAAGGAQADQGRRGLHLQPAVGHRYRHSARRAGGRSPDEVQPAAARAGLWPHACGGCATRCSPSR